jgi:hypothetical protein
MFSNFFKPEPTIKFKCDVPGYEVGQPVRRAQDVRPDWLTKQLKYATDSKSPKFSSCPGMYDYYRAGYIIPAWEDFEIIVDEKQATINIGKGNSFVCGHWEKMGETVVGNSANIDDDLALHALKLPCPWKVFTKPGYSAFVLPPLFHSPFLRDLFLYPGINDYDSYHTINVMFTPMRKMHVMIYAGTPLLQVIPYKREDVSAEMGLITQKESAEANFTYRTGAPGFYRKCIYKKKTTTINNI